MKDKRKTKSKKPTFELWEVIVITLVASIIMGVSTGCVVYNNKKDNCLSSNDSKYLAEFEKSYKSILENYYDDIDENKLVEAAISGMLSYLGDPYSTYLNENSTTILNDSLNGSYEGVGIEVTTTDTGKINIVNVFDDSPAQKAGVHPGDIITKINDIDMANKTSNDAVSEIQKSKKIKIEVNRNSKILSFDLEKASLYVPSISAEIKEYNNQKVGYIKINKFSDTTYEQFKKELTNLETKQINSLIIDVRNNTGGYLSDATNIAKMFLQKGKLIYSLQNKLTKEDTVDDTEESRNYKVYMLINNGSASASEVLASALKYSYGATLVGVKSYGKGKVQKTSTLSDGTMYKYTSAKWLTPKGNCIDEIGLTPDIEVNLSEEYMNDRVPEKDNQLQTALFEMTKAQ